MALPWSALCSRSVYVRRPAATAVAIAAMALSARAPHASSPPSAAVGGWARSASVIAGTPPASTAACARASLP